MDTSLTLHYFGAYITFLGPFSIVFYLGGIKNVEKVLTSSSLHFIRLVSDLSAVLSLDHFSKFLLLPDVISFVDNPSQLEKVLLASPDKEHIIEQEELWIKRRFFGTDFGPKTLLGRSLFFEAIDHFLLLLVCLSDLLTISYIHTNVLYFILSISNLNFVPLAHEFKPHACQFWYFVLWSFWPRLTSLSFDQSRHFPSQPNLFLVPMTT